MHIHILGICGTFMGGLALLARELGHTVRGSDANVYATSKLFVQASGGSDVSYKGNPHPVNANMSGGSDLHHQ